MPTSFRVRRRFSLHCTCTSALSLPEPKTNHYCFSMCVYRSNFLTLGAAQRTKSTILALLLRGRYLRVGTDDYFLDIFYSEATSSSPFLCPKIPYSKCLWHRGAPGELLDGCCSSVLFCGPRERPFQEVAVKPLDCCYSSMWRLTGLPTWRGGRGKPSAGTKRVSCAVIFCCCFFFFTH